MSSESATARRNSTISDCRCRIVDGWPTRSSGFCVGYWPARKSNTTAVGLLANGVVPGMKEAYEHACRDNGFEPGFLLLPERDAPTSCFVADDVDAAWDEIGEYLLHDAMAYAAWNPDNTVSANITPATTVDELRSAASSHVILSVDEARDRIARGETFNISPLCGGIPPDIAWPYLMRFAELG